MRIISKLILIPLIICTLCTYCFSQFEVGVKAGLNSTDVLSEGIMVNNGPHHFKLSLNEASYGFQMGFYTRLSFLGIYLEPNVFFNSSKNSFRLDNFGEGEITGTIFSESYHHLDIPIFLGMKAGILRLQLGPVAHIYMDSSSDLFNIDGYEQKFKTATYGIQGGIGLDLWKIRLDLNYEANLSKFGEHITINGEEYSFGDNPSRLIANIGWKF